MMMQMMMASQGMGQQANSNTGGGSMAGGDTSQSFQNEGGDATGDAAESRNISRGSGQAANLPAEFRKSFEAYYQQLEQIESSAVGTPSTNPESTP